MVAVLNEYFDTMVACIQAHGGMVDKFMGDAVMAAFGGLIPLDNPAQEAVAAALEMRTALQGLNERNAQRGIPRLENGIGIHFGEVLQGPIGSRDRKEFTVIGDAVNIASRLEGLTRDGQARIHVSDAVHDRLPSDLKGRCSAVGPTLLKGKQKEVMVFAVE